MTTYFTDLFQYNQFQNGQFIAIFQQQEVPQKAMLLFSHIFNAHQIWLNRIHQHIGHPSGPTYMVWQVHPTVGLKNIDESVHHQTFQLLTEKRLDFDTPIIYKNTSGNVFTNSFQEMLTHLVNHGTHHRGQIASLLRGTEIAPPATDYIFYKRK